MVALAVAERAELVSLWRRSSFTALLVTRDVEEADITVDRPCPRHRGDAHLAELRWHILALLRLDAT